MMLRQRLAIAAATPNLIPMPTAHAPLDRSTRQIAVRPEVRPLENRPSHSSNPHRSQRRNRAPSGPRFRALALLGRLSWERVDAFVMQASEKPAQFQTSKHRTVFRNEWPGSSLPVRLEVHHAPDLIATSVVSMLAAAAT